MRFHNQADMHTLGSPSNQLSTGYIDMSVSLINWG